MAREKWDNLLFKKVWFPVIKRNLQEENLLYKILQTSVIFLSLINLWIQMKYHQKSYFICCPLPTSLGTRAETENSSELLFKISPKYYQSPKKKKNPRTLERFLSFSFIPSLTANTLVDHAMPDPTPALCKNHDLKTYIRTKKIKKYLDLKLGCVPLSPDCARSTIKYFILHKKMKRCLLPNSM